MLELSLMMAFGKLQENFDSLSTISWGLIFGGISFLLNFLFGINTSIIGNFIVSLIISIIACGYFSALRHFANNLVVWLFVFIFVPILLFLIVL